VAATAGLLGSGQDDRAAQAEIARPGAPGAVGASVLPLAPGFEIPVAEVSLADYAAAGYPDLLRAQLVTVHRPWRITDPLWGAVAWRIRRHQARILGLPAEAVLASHAMIYAGGGNYWSQGARFTLERIEEYKGCDLYHFDLGWDMPTRNALMGECGPHANETYGYRDIAALAMWSLTGRKSWLEAIGDPDRLICSERVCELVRRLSEILGDRPCIELVPHLLHLLLTEVAQSVAAIRPV